MTGISPAFWRRVSKNEIKAPFRGATEAPNVIRLTRVFLLAGLTALISVSAQAEFIADGARLVQLTKDGKTTASAWVPQGDWLLIMREVSESQDQLLIMKADGSEERVVCPVGRPVNARWSWAGDKIVYGFANQDTPTSQGGIYVYDVATDSSTRVSAPYTLENVFTRGGIAGAPWWSHDGRYVSYCVRSPTSGKQEVWSADLKAGTQHSVTPQRGEAENASWNWSGEPRMALLVQDAGDSFDVVTVGPHNSDAIKLTDVGQQDVNQSHPRWSPAEDWIAFTSNLELTKTERGKGYTDAWLARPDGSETINLTRSSSPATEDHLKLYDPQWSWDGKWMAFMGRRFENRGKQIASIFFAEPKLDGEQFSVSSDPRTQNIMDHFRIGSWSYDSTKFAILNIRVDAHNWGDKPTYDRPRYVVTIFDIKSRTQEDILILDADLDRKLIYGGDHERLSGMTWSPDSRSIFLSIANIISESEEIMEPDAYRLDLPERLVSAKARDRIGPPIKGRRRSARQWTASQKNGDAPEAPVQAEAVHDADGKPTVTRTIRPVHMTVAEAMLSLPVTYKSYLPENAPRNMLIFNGPAEKADALAEDLALIDVPADHILIDLMAVEMTEEANRSLGLDWTFSEGRFGFFLPEGNAARDLTPSSFIDGLQTFPAGGAGQSFYQGVGELPKQFFVRLSTLVKDGEATILANPRTVSESGKESEIEIRTTLNFFFSEGFDTGGRPIVKKSDITADTNGKILPVLLPDGRIKLNVEVQVGTFTFTADEQLPESISRKSTTEVTVAEKQTIVLGGLRQQEEVVSETRVPILGDIPYIKHFFRKTQRDVRQSVLTIFITPQILRPDDGNPEWPQLPRKRLSIKPIMTESEEEWPF